MQHLRIGSFLQNGKYKIEKVLGQGGFGITYLATQKISIEGPIGQIDTEIKLAIKEFFMKDICNRDEDSSIVSIPSVGSQQLAERFKQKFIKEARNISRLKHAHIIKVVDVFEENGTAYYVMEYHGNGSLNSLIKQNGPMPEDKATNYILQIASALEYIHNEQMNHLDIKPDNILLNNKGEAILIDFGLSKCYDAGGEQTSSTPVGVSVGYAPLEQSRVGGVETFSPATDIYSLGATFYKLLTGNTPPDASEVLDEGLPDMGSNISVNIQNLITQAMEPRRKKRPQSIREFLSLFGDKSTESKLVDSEETKVVINQEVSFEETVIVDSIAQKPNINNNNIFPTIPNNDWNSVEAIDLGLSIKWANMNWTNNASMWCDINPNLIHLDGITESEHDVVYVSTLKKYRMPTLQEWRELQLKCKWEWCSNNLGCGYLVTGTTGNSIFLPANGKIVGEKHVAQNLKGYYWTSNKPLERNEAYYIYFDQDIIDFEREPFDNVLRYIRPVAVSR